MVLSEKDFVEQSDKHTLKSLFSKQENMIVHVEKNMTNTDWHKYKNGYI